MSLLTNLSPVIKRMIKVWGTVLRQKGYTWFLLAGIIIVSALVYLPPYRDSFVLDDFKHFEFVRSFSESPLQVYKMFDPFWLGWHYRPVQSLLMFIGLVVLGSNPVLYYVALLILHAVSIILLYKIARRLEVGRFGSFCGVILFALNAQHWQVLGWISSIGITAAATFSLLAVYFFVRYLECRKQWVFLPAMVVFCLLALLSREESLILPVLLLLMWLIYPHRQRPARAEVAFFAILLSFWLIYLRLQIVRPSWVASVSLKGLFESLVEQDISHFWLDLVSRYTLIDVTLWVQSDTTRTMFVVLCITLAGIWFWKAGRAVRFGLLWGALYLGFLYLIVWVPNPFGLSERYMYLPWMGISLAFGAGFDCLVARSGTKHSRALIAVGLVAFLSVHVVHVRQSQKTWLVEAENVKSIQSQMMSLLPNPPGDAHFFAYRLASQPDYVQAMATVWYERSFRWPGGDFSRLKKQGWATSEYYLFDYHEGVLYNLMPELQEHAKTWFVWSREPSLAVWDERDQRFSDASDSAFYYAVDQIAGPPRERRFSIVMHSPEEENSWAALGYTVEIPRDSTLWFAVIKEGGELVDEDGMVFRVRVQGISGRLDTIFETFVENSAPGMPAGWAEASVSLEAYWGQTVKMYFEVAAGANALHDYGYWANPRLVVDAF
jgi:hypothetical protein